MLQTSRLFPLRKYLCTLSNISHRKPAPQLTKKSDSTPAMTDILQIPLHDFHAEQGARFVSFGGWNMPVQYTSILEEHKAVRTNAGLFDVSHMGEFHVSGPDAALFLDKLLVNAICNAPIGKAVYSPMCASDGGVVDDLIVYRTGAETFLVCVNASNIEKDFGWFLKQAERWELEVQIEDHSDQYALLALQGPKAQAILEAVGFDRPWRNQEILARTAPLRRREGTRLPHRLHRRGRLRNLRFAASSRHPRPTHSQRRRAF